jgi:methylmalonyl-CoA epimerase
VPEIIKINHIALVVEDIDTALFFWRDCLGLLPEKITEVPKEESIVAFLGIGGSDIELVQPTSPESGVAKFLTKRGPGMHHLCLQVNNIQNFVDDLVDRGVKMINEKPALGEDGHLYAFIHPKSAYGVLVELYEGPEGTQPKFPVLNTKRLVLRQFQMKDAHTVYEMFAREDMNHYLETETMQSIEEAELRVQNRISLFEKGWGCRWAIAPKESPEDLIGSCGYFKVRVGTHTVEIGFEVHPEYWRQGIMTEAMTSILDYSFSDNSLLPVNRVEALVDPANRKSIALLKSLGFWDEGVRRKFGYWKGSYHDVKLFALLCDDWKLRTNNGGKSS